VGLGSFLFSVCAHAVLLPLSGAELGGWPVACPRPRPPLWGGSPETFHGSFGGVRGSERFGLRGVS
jgi:hypothetical protein